MYMPHTYGPELTPTQDTYDALQNAYEQLNWSLFEGKLPNCLITMQRRARTYGYYTKERFRRGDGQHADEIGLNPSHFSSRSLEDTLATLAHEMVHVWQHHFGSPGRGRYHNREWADKMIEIGLQPSDTGEEGGRETGDAMHHYVIADGKFDTEARALIAGGFEITWKEQKQAASANEPNWPASEKAEDKSGKRPKYTCPKCGLNAWAKHDAVLICGTDKQVMAPAS